MFFNNLKIFLSLKSYFLLLWAFEKKLGCLLKRKWLFLDLFWVCFVVTVFGLWCPLLIHWIHLQCVDEKFHQQPSVGHTANLPLCHQSRTRTLALCFKPGGLIWSIHLKRIHHPHCIQTLCIPRSLGHNTVPRQPAQGHLCHTCPSHLPTSH